MSGPVAAIDLGTNSLRLLVLDGHGRVLRRENRIVRLGEGVDASRTLGGPALERVRRALTEYEQAMSTLGVERVRMVATSAARSASNPQDLQAVVQDVLGIGLEIISGDDEADLSFAGATRALRARGALQPGDTLVVDLGGGSTEFVRGSRSVTAAVSVELGSVRLTERVLHTDPPSQQERDSAVQQTDTLVGRAFTAVPLEGVRNVVGVAGTVTTLSALTLGLERYDPELVDGVALDIEQMRALCGRVVTMTTTQRLALGDIPAGRADVIGAGALIWDRVLARVSQETGLTRTITSEADILDGVATGLLA